MDGCIPILSYPSPSLYQIVESCCRCVLGLRALNASLGRAGACRLLMEAFAAHPASGPVAQAVCRAVGSLAECADNKAHLDEQHVCRTLTLTLARHVAGGGGAGNGAGAGAGAGAGGVFATVFAAQSTHSAAVAQWGSLT